MNKNCVTHRSINKVQRCKDCLQRIDPELCWCGDLIKGHTWLDGHSPVPMGCVCGDYNKHKKPTMSAYIQAFLEDHVGNLQVALQLQPFYWKRFALAFNSWRFRMSTDNKSLQAGGTYADNKNWSMYRSKEIKHVINFWVVINEGYIDMTNEFFDY